MTKSGSPRAATIDWSELERQVSLDNFGAPRWLELWQSLEDEAQPGEMIKDRIAWEERYVHALQKSIEGRDHQPLLDLLQAGKPLHPRLLPALAEAIRMIVQGLARGQPRALSSFQEDVIASHVRMLTPLHKVGEARRIVAEERGISVDTIIRAEKAVKARGKLKR